MQAKPIIPSLMLLVGMTTIMAIPIITTSGMFWHPALLCAYLTLGADRILFAVDYPYESNSEAVEFMETAPISDTDKEKIYHLNAEKLLAL